MNQLNCIERSGRIRKGQIDKMGLEITKLWAGHDFAARSCCDLDLQGSDQKFKQNIIMF